MDTDSSKGGGRPSQPDSGNVESGAPGHSPSDSKDLKKTILLALGSLGVVYGDIGTSPLYAVKECFHGTHGIALTPANLLGVMSLIFWSLTIVVMIKYVIFILMADNEGEGGMFALTALFLGKGAKRLSGRTVNSLIFLGIFGAALFYGDGIITPVISVLSAVEGLNVATKAAEPFVLPIACVILAGLFLFQYQGTERIGKVFGPIMLVWFTAIAALGLAQVLRRPEILAALDPRYAVSFFYINRLHGAVVLGAVVLCLTGASALYADLGHFGRRPIRLSWNAVVFPALVLNYFGQTALLLEYPQAAANPFYELIPRVLLYPMVGLATIAAVIASQAMITGVYSLTQQAIQLGYCPRLRIVHTSGETKGQIYMPWVNTMMMIGCLGLALAFKQSSGLAAAYGIAVMGNMAITTIIYYYVARYNWDWPAWKALAPACIFLFFDLSYFGANLLKFVDGGWLAVSIAILLTLVMVTWRDGRALLAKLFADSQVPVEVILKDIQRYKLMRTHSTGVFLSVSPTGTPITMLHLLKHTDSLPQRVILMSIVSTNTPFVTGQERVAITNLGKGFYRLIASFGFMETPSIPEILDIATKQGLSLDTYSATFYVGRETLLSTGGGLMSGWRKGLFAYLSRNSWNVTTFFNIPPNRVVELGSQVEL